MEFLGVFGTVALAFSVCFGFYLAGRRVKAGEVATWKDNYDAEHTRAERLQATLVEKDIIMAGMSERLERLDGMLQESAGRKVYEALLESQAQAHDQQERNLALFMEMRDAIRNLTHTVEKAANGHS